jgi:hypothetical protein
MRKISLIAIATSIVSLAIAGTANAAVKILDYSSASATNVVWSGTTLTLNDNNTVVVPFLGQNGGAALTGQTVAFTGLSYVSNTTTADTLSGGTFNIGSGLLTGTFTSATLSGINSTSGAVAFTGVVYTGGTWFPAGYSTSVGTQLSTQFGYVSGVFVAGSGPSTAFTALDSTNAFATVASTPEPASVATFGIGAMALMLLAAVARRRNANMTL